MADTELKLGVVRLRLGVGEYVAVRAKDILSVKYDEDNTEECEVMIGQRYEGAEEAIVEMHYNEVIAFMQGS